MAIAIGQPLSAIMEMTMPQLFLVVRRRDAADAARDFSALVNFATASAVTSGSEKAADIFNTLSTAYQKAMGKLPKKDEPDEWTRKLRAQIEAKQKIKEANT